MCSKKSKQIARKAALLLRLACRPPLGLVVLSPGRIPRHLLLAPHKRVTGSARDTRSVQGAV